MKKQTPDLFARVMKKPENKTLVQAASLLILFALTGILIFLVQRNIHPSAAAKGSGSTYVSAEVMQVKKDNTSADASSGERMVGSQQLQIRILEGAHSGEVMEVENDLSALHNVYAHQGTRIVVRMNTQTNGSYSASVYNYDRRMALYGLAAVFLLLLCLAGGRKGIRSMFGLLYSVVCIIFLMLPMLLNDMSPIGSAIIVSVLTTAVCFVLLDGINRKTVSAALGTTCGVVVSGLAAVAAGGAATLSGFNMQEAESLLLQVGSNKIQIDGLLVAGIIISSLGAVMDIAISISSSIYELHQVNPKLGSAALFHSGISIGRDSMGTMANTLILAFVGSSLNMLVLIYSYGIPFSQLINTDLIGVEIIQGVAASIGVVLTVPLVTLISARVISQDKTNAEKCRKGIGRLNDSRLRE